MKKHTKIGKNMTRVNKAVTLNKFGRNPPGMLQTSTRKMNFSQTVTKKKIKSRKK